MRQQHLVLLVSILTTITVPGTGHLACQPGWSSYRQFCFKLFSVSYSWSSAKSLCKSNGAELATIPDSGTQSFIASNIIPNENYNVWIGLNDISSEGSFVWEDGSSFSYNYWASGQPNDNNNQDCAHFWADNNYHWADSECYLGYNALCKKQAAQDCTKTYNSDDGLILSPYYPYKYINNAMCQWTIRVENGFGIKLIFYPPFETESCTYDYVKVFDVQSYGVKTARGTWCGSNIPPVLVSTTSTIMVEFKTDGSNVYKGFSASWQKVVSTCGGTFNTNSDKGLILSPNYPSLYENNENCRWTIDVESGYVIKLVFAQPFDVENYGSCGHDSVKVYEVLPNGQKNLKGSYCGTNPPKEFISSSSRIEVDFISDSSNVGKGFSASWFKSVAQCGGNFVNEDRGLILSPNYPSPYDNGEFCKWAITVEQGFVVRLVFDPPFQLESGGSDCSFDSVKAFDMLPGGQRNLIGTWCGNILPPVVLSSSSRIDVEFKTDGSNVQKGFSLSWFKIVKPCDLDLVGMQGKITSPDFPESYRDNLNCRIDISVPDGHFVELDFNSTFDLGIRGDKSCNHDKIEIFDVLGNDTLLTRGQWCGSTPPPLIKSFGSRLVVEFHSDYNNNTNGAGFQASWRAVTDCGWVFQANQGHFMTYNYSQDTSYNYKDQWSNPMCVWDINIDEGFQVHLEFHPLVSVSTCGDIKIMDYPLGGSVSRQMQGWCGSNTINQQVTSLGHRLLVTFQPSYGDIQGFFASWKSVCGEAFTSDKGNLTSPNYGTSYPANLDCEWTIEGSKDHVLHLDFHSPFEIEATNDKCHFDYVEVFDSLPDGSLVSKGRFCGHQTPPLLVSSSSKVVVRFHSDEDKSGKGFSISWDNACGDVYKSKKGKLTSPNYPSNYPDNFDCRWEIQSVEGHVIRLTFLLPFSVEENPGCDADYVQLYDFSDKGAAVNKRRWCGTKPPPVQKSTSSRMMVVFHSDDRKTSKGFQAVWDSVCGEVLKTAKGTFSSPGYSHEYPPNLDCEWEIEADKNHVVHLHFKSPFGMEASNDNGCGFDYVEVFDSMSDGNLVSKGKFCGDETPPNLISSSTKMVVRFHSDQDKSGKGFSASWNTACGDVYHSNHGEIKSPDYPSGYPNDFDCRWEIQVDEGHVVRLTFESPFSLEHNNRFVADYVQLFDVPDKGNLVSKGQWSGTNIPPLQKSTTSKMVVVFHSDDKINGVGFHAVWDSVCGEAFHSSKGNLSSPGYGREYPSNLDCEWEIQGVNKHHVHLFFHSPFQIEASNEDSCGFDHVEVLDSLPNGTLVSRGKFCGHQTPPPLISSSSKVVVRFHSDKDKSGKGFSVSWDTACGEVLNSNKGEFTSPNYPVGYPNNFECRWEIHVDQGHVIRLSFQPPFSLEDNTRFVADYVEVYDYLDDGTLVSKGQWSGTDIPPTQRSTTSKMVVVFHSDDRINGAGFHAVWDSVCGDVMTGSEGHFSSPGYPLHYPNNLDCRWEIRVTPGQRVRLKFDSTFDLEIDSHGNCGYDDVEVIDYFSNGTTINEGKWCGIKKPSEIISTTSNLTVAFHSDNDKNGIGFNVSWSAVGGCGNTFHTKEGFLMSPNYPLTYPVNQDCRWEIDPPDGSSVTLSFDTLFNVEEGTDCAWDYVQVFRGNLKIGQWCGNNPPPSVTSNGQKLVIVFKSDKSNSRKGFFASWTTDQ